MTDFTTLGKQIAQAAVVTDLGTDWGDRLFRFDASEQFGMSVDVHGATADDARPEAEALFAAQAERLDGVFTVPEKPADIVPVTAAAQAELELVNDEHPDGPLWRATTTDDRGVQVMLHADTDNEARGVLHSYLEELVTSEAAA